MGQNSIAIDSPGSIPTTDAATFKASQILGLDQAGRVIRIGAEAGVVAAGAEQFGSTTSLYLPTTALLSAPGATVSSVVTGTVFHAFEFSHFSDAAVLSGLLQLPSTWTTFDVFLWWYNAGANEGDVRWEVKHSAAVVPAAAIPAHSTKDLTVTAGALDVVQRTGPFEDLEVHDLLALRIIRSASHASDTLANAVRLLGVELVQAS